MTFVVGMTEADASKIAWRLLATLAGALAPGSDRSRAHRDGRELSFVADLPASLVDEGDLFAATAPAQQRAISAGMSAPVHLAAGAGRGRSGRRHAGAPTRHAASGVPALTAHPAAHTVMPRGNGVSPAA